MTAFACTAALGLLGLRALVEAQINPATMSVVPDGGEVAVRGRIQAVDLALR